MEYLYVVGYFYDDGTGFNLCYDWRAATCDREVAEQVLTNWCKKHGGKKAQIYRIKRSDMVAVEKDKKLNDFGVLKEALQSVTERMVCWWNEEDDLPERDRFHNVWIDCNLKYDEKKKTAVVVFKYDSVRSFYYTETDDERMANTLKVENKIKNDLDNLVQYHLIPSVKQKMKEYDIDLRMEFKLFGKKMHKGFITKE